MRRFFVYGMGVVVMLKSYPLTPALSPKGARGKGSKSGAVQSQSSTPDFQVGVTRTFTSVSPLSYWERVRVRGF
jgi:hypothetical protein